MTKFDVKREATLAAILKVGVAWFPERGFRGVSMRDVADEASVSTGALYFHFPSKEHFFVAAMKANDEHRGEGGWWLAGSDPTNTDLAQAVADGLARMNADPNPNGVTWLPAMLEFDLSAKDNPEFQPVVKELYDQWVGELERFVVLVDERGWVRRDMPTREIAENLLALHHGMWIQYGFFGFDPRHAADLTIRILQP